LQTTEAKESGYNMLDRSAEIITEEIKNIKLKNIF
jgi:hypothetical protein